MPELALFPEVAEEEKHLIFSESGIEEIQEKADSSDQRSPHKMYRKLWSVGVTLWKPVTEDCLSYIESNSTPEYEYSKKTNF